MFGVNHVTAVINPPGAAILAVGGATDGAVVRDGVVVVGSTTTLIVSIDHPVLDGASAPAFLRDLRSICEEPLRVVVCRAAPDGHVGRASLPTRIRGRGSRRGGDVSEDQVCRGATFRGWVAGGRA